jgi:hypothetical protein
MKPVDLNLPDGCELYNKLYRTSNPDYLVQDILVVRLLNGFVIDVGWFPEHDPNGNYVIVVADGKDDELREIRAKSADEVRQYVEFLAARYADAVIHRPGSVGLDLAGAAF